MRYCSKHLEIVFEERCMKRKDLKYLKKNQLYFIYIYQRWDVYEVWNCFQRPLMSAHCTTHLNYKSAKCTTSVF